MVIVGEFKQHTETRTKRSHFTGQKLSAKASRSIPMICGPGVPARRSCTSRYCFSSALIVFQSRWVSRATSRIVETRHRRPTQKEKRFV